jgi:hypothetical protein
MNRNFHYSRSYLVLFALISPLLVSCASSRQDPRPVTASTADTAATSTGARAVLRWQTETESNTFAYFVYRGTTPDGEFVCINKDTPLNAAGTASVPHKYVYFDLTVEPGKTYYYKLQSKDLDGSTEWIVGSPKPVQGVAKSLTVAELEEIRTKGQAYREEAK